MDSKVTAELVERLLRYCRENRRVCPMPQKWNTLWQMLPERVREGASWKPPLPLILGAWWNTPDSLEEHIDWAARHGALAEVDEYLRSLPESDWAHLEKLGPT